MHHHTRQQAAANEAAAKLQAAEAARDALQAQLAAATADLTAARGQVAELQQQLKREKEQQVRVASVCVCVCAAAGAVAWWCCGEGCSHCMRPWHGCCCLRSLSPASLTCVGCQHCACPHALPCAATHTRTHTHTGGARGREPVDGAAAAAGAEGAD
jgi:hypothetical protein